MVVYFKLHYIILYVIVKKTRQNKNNMVKRNEYSGEEHKKSHVNIKSIFNRA